MSRLSGPLLDRIDITVAVKTPSRALTRSEATITSAQVRDRVAEARARQCRRLSGSGWTLNAELPGPWIRAQSGIDAGLVERIDSAVEAHVLTMRGADRVLRLMWTLADLAGRAAPDGEDLARALALRTGGPHAQIGA